MGFFSSLFGKKSPDVINLPGPGTFSVPIVGESHYQQALESICGRRKVDGEEKLVKAMLILDNANPVDKLAVRVEINGLTVGHLSKKDARQYRAQLKQARRPNAIIACQAEIRGGWERPKGKGQVDRGHYGVWLDLPTDEDD
jgi:hypothetical protein